MVWAWPSAECSASMRANSAQPRGSLCLKACRIGASAYFAAAAAMPSSANILPVSAASAFIASRLPISGAEPQPQPAAVTDRQRRVGAHGVADHMRLVDAERIHDRDDVVARAVLRVTRGVGRHVRGRI